MAWIEVHTNLPRHPKTMQLQERLRMKMPAAIGHLCLLWLWALENAPDGRLNRMDAKALAKICQIPLRRSEEYLEALLACGFLDRNEQGLMIHDWESYAGRYDVIRRKNAQRQKEYRQRYARKHAGNDNVTGLQDSTGEDSTGEDSTGKDPSLFCGADDEYAPPLACVSDFLDRQGLEGGEAPDTDPELRQACDGLTGEIFRRFCSRPPTELDRSKVFNCLTRRDDSGRTVMDPERRELLLYAFQQAAQAGRPGSWPYIEGVLGRLHRRGVRNLNAAEDYDYERSFRF